MASGSLMTPALGEMSVNLARRLTRGQTMLLSPAHSVCRSAVAPRTVEDTMPAGSLLLRSLLPFRYAVPSGAAPLTSFSCQVIGFDNVDQVKLNVRVIQVKLNVRGPWIILSRPRACLRPLQRCPYLDSCFGPMRMCAWVLEPSTSCRKA